MLKIKVADSPFYAYCVAIGITALALLVSWMTWPIIYDAPFLFFMGAVVLSAWQGGLGPSMLSAVIIIVSADRYFIDPGNTMFTSHSDLLQFAIFSLIAFLIGSLEERHIISENSLRQLRDELDVILNTVHDGITAIDREGKIVFANSAAKHLSRHTVLDLILSEKVTGSSNGYEVYDEESNPFPLFLMPHFQVFVSAKSKSKMLRIRKKDTDEQKWFHIASSPVFDEKGAVKLAVNVIRDITHEMQTHKDRAQLIEIVQNSDDAIIGKSLEGIIQSWNPGATYLYGYSAEEAIGQHISLIFPDDIRTREIRLIERVLSGERIHHYETKRVSKAGSTLDISLTISPIRDEAGILIGYSTIERNITNRKRRENEINRLRAESQQRHRHLQTIVSNIPGIVYTGAGFDSTGNPTMNFISDYAETMLGYSSDEWLVASNLWKQIIHPDDWQEVINQADQIHKSGEPGTIRFRCITKSGKILYAEAHTSTMQNDSGVPVGTCGVVMDITEGKQAQDELIQTSMLLEALHQRFLNLVSNVPGIVYEQTIDRETGDAQYNYISNYTKTMLGYPAEMWRKNAQFWREIVPAEDIETVLFDTVSFENDNTNTSGQKQFRSYDKHGQLHTLEAYYNSVLEKDSIKAYGLIMDVTARKQLEFAEREQREFAEALADISALLTSSLNQDVVFERILSSLHRVVPHDAASITIIENGTMRVIQHRNINMLATLNGNLQNQLQIYDDLFAQEMLLTGEGIIIDDLHKRFDNLPPSPFRSYMRVPIQLQKRMIGHIHLLGEGVSFFEEVHVERLNAFSRLAAISIQNARLFDESQQLAAIEERQRLARELHDSVSQSLFTCRTMSETAIRRWYKAPDHAYELMQKVNQMTATALAEMRVLLLELRPASLKHVNLKQLFEQYLRPIQERREFDLAMKIDDIPLLPSEVKIALYRIAQEALNNIDKHAQASFVDMSATYDNEQIVLEIRDDGRGFSTQEVASTSLGLNIMRERAEDIGALLEIVSQPHQGTQIRVIWTKEKSV